MSNRVNLPMNKYRIEWTEPKHKNGYFAKKSVIVFGEESVTHVINTVVPDPHQCDIIPCL